MSGAIELYCDGGLLGKVNPCPEGVHWSVYCTPPGAVVLRDKSTEHHTNNEAEWLALIAAFTYARESHPGQAIVVRSDSRFVVNVFNGLWKVGNLRMRRLMFACHEAARGITQRRVEWVPRRELVKRVGH